MATKAGTLQRGTVLAPSEKVLPQSRAGRRGLQALVVFLRSDAAARKSVAGWGTRAEIGRETGARI
jgi:hypothetical protein